MLRHGYDGFAETADRELFRHFAIARKDYQSGGAPIAEDDRPMRPIRSDLLKLWQQCRRALTVIGRECDNSYITVRVENDQTTVLA